MDEIKSDADISEIEEHDYMEDTLTDLTSDFDSHDKFNEGKDYVEENFNIIDLVTHRSGLGLGVGDLMFFPQGSDFTIDDLLSSFQHFKQESAFRTKWDYDNLLYLVAGELIARKSGLTWEAFIESRIFEPLGMENSHASLASITDTSNLSASHSTETGEMRIIPTFEEMINGAAGGIFSNVNDLSQWMLLHLNRGKYGENNKQQLITQANHYEMWKIHTVMDVNRNPRYNSHFAGYGMVRDFFACFFSCAQHFEGKLEKKH